MKRQGYASVSFLGIELGEELSVDGAAGSEENHIVMNERVQALAGSIYEVELLLFYSLLNSYILASGLINTILFLQDVSKNVFFCQNFSRFAHVDIYKNPLDKTLSLCR